MFVLTLLLKRSTRWRNH